MFKSVMLRFVVFHNQRWTAPGSEARDGPPQVPKPEMDRPNSGARDGAGTGDWLAVRRPIATGRSNDLSVDQPVAYIVALIL